MCECVSCDHVSPRTTFEPDALTGLMYIRIPPYYSSLSSLRGS